MILRHCPCALKWASLGALLFIGPAVHAQNFTVTVSGTAYVVNGMLNRPLTLVRGATYVFSVTAIGHPFFIKTNFISGTGSVYHDGVTGNGVQNGTLTFVVPTNAPNELYYHCGVHPGMGGIITVISPPSVSIVSISVSTSNVTLRSTGASGWNAVPEYSSNLVLGTWESVPAFNNTFLSGTNTTTFSRLDAICGPNVFIRVRNQLGN